MSKHKKTQNQLIKVITQYGIHIWAILVIANAVLVYAYQFSTHAAGKPKIPNQGPDATTASASGTPANGPTLDPSDPSNAQGPLINISFTVPGIGSGGGNMKPLHTKRNVIVFLYQTTVNTLDSKVKPLYTIHGTATFDTDTNSPTYTSFVNPTFDLGSTVIEGDYQMVLRTDQSARTVVKENPTDVGGKSVSLSKRQQSLLIPHQTMTMGDTIPDDGDNQIDVTDYNAFINCYGEKYTSSFCQGKNYGDFDDNGVIDGVDYNILLRGLSILQQEGRTIPQVPITKTTPSAGGRVAPLKGDTKPTPKPTRKPTLKPSPTAAVVQQTSSGGGSSLGGILFFLFLLLLGGGLFFVYKTNEGFRNKIRALIHLSPTGEPSEPAGETSSTDDQNTAGFDPAAGAALASDMPVSSDVPAADQTQTPTEVQTPPAATPTAPATTEPAPQPTTPPITQTHPSPPAPAPTAPAADGTVENEYYVKKKGPDAAGIGEWLLLTDDNGPVEAHYSKNDAVDGFAKVKGIMKTENGKTFLEISELTAE